MNLNFPEIAHDKLQLPTWLVDLRDLITATLAKQGTNRVQSKNYQLQFYYINNTVVQSFSTIDA